MHFIILTIAISRNKEPGMGYIAHIYHRHGTSDYTLELAQVDHEAVVHLDGDAFPYDWRQLSSLATGEGGHYTMLIAGRSYEVFARRLSSTTHAQYEIFVGNERFEVTIEDERSHTLAALTRGKAGR